MSFRDLGKANGSLEQKELLQSKRRMEAKLARVMNQRKNIYKNSMLIDIVKEEKQKSQILQSLMDKSGEENDEDDNISEKSSEESPETEKKSKCCGLIKTKKKVPDTPTKTIASKTLGTPKKKSSSSSVR